MGGKYHEYYSKNKHLISVKRYRRKCQRIDRCLFLDDLNAKSRFHWDLTFDKVCEKHICKNRI